MTRAAPRVSKLGAAGKRTRVEPKTPRATKAKSSTVKRAAVSAARFERRDVDVVQCYPPVSSALLARDDTHVLFNSTLIPDAIADILAADADFVTEHPDKLAAILRAYARARKFYLKHPGAAVEIMARRTGMTATEFEAGLAGVSLVHPDESADSAGDLEARLQNSLSITARALIKMGLITGRDLTDDLLAPMELSELAAR